MSHCFERKEFPVWAGAPLQHPTQAAGQAGWLYASFNSMHSLTLTFVLVWLFIMKSLVAQAAVVDVIRRRAAPLSEEQLRHTRPGSAGPHGGVLLFECLFDDGPSAVEVHLAGPKTTARMLEKLADYAPPHPQSEWPLCANILDPVRLSVVCRGPQEIIQVRRPSSIML